MRELSIFLNTADHTPLYLQIYSYIKNEIETGNLKKGDLLPSQRRLSESLQVSRSTVLMAYDQLKAEGYIDSRDKKGCFVNEIDKRIGEDKDYFSSSKKNSKSGMKYGIEFSPDGIEIEKFPFAEWRRISKNVFSGEMKQLYNSGERFGEYGLREKIGEYLFKSRGVKTDPERIVIGAGNEALLQLLAITLGRDSVYAVENPTYMKSYSILRNISENVRPVSLDKNGIEVPEIIKSGANIVYVTPSHQYPLGIVMPIKRRIELLKWAGEEEGRYIIEDDYDSEFRYKGKPIPALLSIDSMDKVIYIGTFSKAISPAIRMNYMVVPKSLYERFTECTSFYSNSVSRIDQKIVEIFMEEGGFERNLSRMRTVYKNKHEIIMTELKKWKNTEVSGENAGAHVLLTIKNGMSETELVSLAAKKGIKVYPLSLYYIGNEKRNDSTIILGYARLGINEILEGLHILKEIYGV